METDLYNPVPGSVLCLANPGCHLSISPSLLSQFPFQSSSFMFPEVEFWCSPAELELELGERPDVSVSPVVTETNTTDHCLLLTEGDNTTQCSRQGSPPGVEDCSEELLSQQSYRGAFYGSFQSMEANYPYAIKSKDPELVLYGIRLLA